MRRKRRGTGPPLLGAIGDGTTRVLLAFLSLYADEGRVTVREIADELELSPSTVHAHLWTLRRLGLVTWTLGTRGTLRPAVRPVRFGQERRAG